MEANNKEMNPADVKLNETTAKTSELSSPDNNMAIDEPVTNAAAVATDEPTPPKALKISETDKMNIQSPEPESTLTTFQPQNPVKKVKRRKKKQKDGPKHPHTGYIRYMNVRRDELRVVYPNATAIDITKIIGVEWTKMSDEKKKPYLDAAEIDRIRFNEEYRTYQQNKKQEEANKQKESNASKATNKSSHNKTNDNLPVESKQSIDKSSNNNLKQSSSSADVGVSVDRSSPLQQPSQQLAAGPSLLSQPSSSSSTNQQQDVAAAPAGGVSSMLKVPRTGEYDIPIFTEEFLEHNKTVDTELRLLRKSNTDYEQQNSILEKHVENMTNGINKLRDESDSLKDNNDVLHLYIGKLRTKLAAALSGLAIPNQPDGANLDNIDNYMSELHRMATSNSHGPASLNKAKDIIRKLDLQIQL